MYESTPDPSRLWTLLTQVEVIHKISGAWKVPADLLRRLDDRATSEAAAEERYISLEHTDCCVVHTKRALDLLRVL